MKTHGFPLIRPAIRAGYFWSFLVALGGSGPLDCHEFLSGRGARDLFLFGSWWLWEVPWTSMAWSGWMGWTWRVVEWSWYMLFRKHKGNMAGFCQEYTPHPQKKKQALVIAFLWCISSFCMFYILCNWCVCWAYFLATENSYIFLGLPGSPTLSSVPQARALQEWRLEMRNS